MPEYNSPKKKRKVSLSASLPDIASTPSKDGGDSSGGELDLSDLLADGNAVSSAPLRSIHPPTLCRFPGI